MSSIPGSRFPMKNILNAPLIFLDQKSALFVAPLTFSLSRWGQFYSCWFGQFWLESRSSCSAAAEVLADASLVPATHPDLAYIPAAKIYPTRALIRGLYTPVSFSVRNFLFYWRPISKSWQFFPEWRQWRTRFKLHTGNFFLPILP